VPWNRPPWKVKALYGSDQPVGEKSMSRVPWNWSFKRELNLLLRLNNYGRPIANKYCEGKMKRTLKRELTDLKLLRRKR
jgi:hypothetical protein